MLDPDSTGRAHPPRRRIRGRLSAEVDPLPEQEDRSDLLVVGADREMEIRTPAHPALMALSR
jgi:hypothetical protein